MGVLNSWQKITRVLPNNPFGDGDDGDITISTTTTQSVANSGCSGTSSSTALTLSSASSFANNDIVVIHQSRGTGVGQWEINQISSGGGTTNLVLSKALQYTYTDSGNSQAQVYELKRYRNVTLNSGQSWGSSNWIQDTGGVFLFSASILTTITGTINQNGTSSTGSNARQHQGKGYESGPCDSASPNNQYGYQGEGTGGARTKATSANGNGGGGAYEHDPNDSAGGGGGNGTAGGTGVTEGGIGVGGVGGSTAGQADLTNMVFGGGGGGGALVGGDAGGDGGTGAGIALIISKILTVNGGINANGGNGNTGDSAPATGGGGGGAGGSILIQCMTATIGSNLITASAGSGQEGGGNGGSGRIAIHHSGAITGATSPTYTDVTDGSLQEVGGSFIFNLI